MIDAPASPATAPLTTAESDELTRLIAYFEESENATREARELSERDKDYVHNIQYSAEELAVLKRRKQPALTINYIKRKVETMRGLERRMRSDPKAFPRTPQDEDGANAATDALRFIGDQANYNNVRSLVYEDMTICGYGGADVTVERTPNDDSKIRIDQVPWERLGYDPHSVKADFSDAKYKFIVIWMDRADAVAQYGGRESAVDGTLQYRDADVYRDTPREQMWCDNRRTRLRVVQMHYLQDGEWMLATFTRGGFLVDPTVSPYVDKDGRSASSLHMRSMYIDRNGNRYGAVRDFISLQDEINKRRSKALHLLTVRQSYGNQQAVPDVQKARTELAKPDGFVEIQNDGKFGQDFGILPTGDMAQGQLELLQQAASEMQATGANAALAGTDPRSQSGRAQQLQQQAGQVTLEPGVDQLQMFTHEVYEAAWLRVKQYWTSEKWVRVTDDERNIRWVGLNKQITLGDKLMQIAQADPQRAQQIAQQEGIQSPYDPRLKRVVKVENDVSGINVDIEIEDGPDITSLQSEQFDALAGLAKAGLPIPPKAIIQASNLRNKDQILDEMEKGAVPPEIQEQLQKLQQELQQASQQNQQLQAKLADRQGEMQLKAKELQIKEAELQLKAQEPREDVDPTTAAAELHNVMADTAVKEATAEQTHMETLIMQRTPPTELTGSVST